MDYTVAAYAFINVFLIALCTYLWGSLRESNKEIYRLQFKIRKERENVQMVRESLLECKQRLRETNDNLVMCRHQAE